MKLNRQHSCSGIALIMVMLVIVTLGILAGGFAFSMRVETRLAYNSRLEPDLEWLGRSGVELARFVLGQQLLDTTQPYTALNQAWAGADWVTNEVFTEITLDNMQLGTGTMSVKIVDNERKVNINIANEVVLDRAFFLMGVDGNDIIPSILSWIDPEEDPLMGAVDSSYYESLDPPLLTKNGPLGDITEMLLIYGVTPELFWGPGGPDRDFFVPAPGDVLEAPPNDTEYGNPIGLIDLFTTISDSRLNINTASVEALQLVEGFDEGIAHEIVLRRAGYDGVEGTEDDEPFRSVSELRELPSMIPELTSALGGILHISSSTFTVTVDTSMGPYSRRFHAVVRRVSDRNLPILHFCWD